MEEFTSWRIQEEGINVRRCENKIRVKACYGDCISLEEGDDSSIALMGSNVISSVNVNDKVVCADPLFEFIKKNNVPPQLRSIYCQQFLNNTFIQNNYSGTSCSAFRFTNPCDSIEYQL